MTLEMRPMETTKNQEPRTKLNEPYELNEPLPRAMTENRLFHGATNSMNPINHGPLTQKDID